MCIRDRKKTDRFFVKILTQMYLWTRKSELYILEVTRFQRLIFDACFMCKYMALDFFLRPAVSGTDWKLLWTRQLARTVGIGFSGLHNKLSVGFSVVLQTTELRYNARSYDDEVCGRWWISKLLRTLSIASEVAAGSSGFVVECHTRLDDIRYMSTEVSTIRSCSVKAYTQ